MKGYQFQSNLNPVSVDSFRMLKPTCNSRTAVAEGFLEWERGGSHNTSSRRSSSDDHARARLLLHTCKAQYMATLQVAAKHLLYMVINIQTINSHDKWTSQNLHISKMNDSLLQICLQFLHESLLFAKP
jgi:hypothetical protein